MRSRRLAVPVIAAALLWALPAPAGAAPWGRSDVFVGVSGGGAGAARYNVYDSAGRFKDSVTVPGTSGGGDATGCALTSYGLFGTNFANDGQGIVQFSLDDPHAVLAGVPTSAANAESIVFEHSGGFYVGHANGQRQIQHYQPNGISDNAFSAATEVRGTDWLDLAADQKTIYYTSLGVRVMRFDAATGTQLADFATVSQRGDTHLVALRLLPPGDGSGGLLVASAGGDGILRLDAGGNVVQTYNAPGESTWFGLDLDPDNGSFWAVDQATTDLYRFNIASGAIEAGPIATNAGGIASGLCVYGGPAASASRPSGAPSTPPATGKAPAAGALPPAFGAKGAILAPSQATCLSSDTLRIRFRRRNGLKYASVAVSVNHKRVGVVPASRIARTATLRGLPAGKVTVGFTVTTTDGRRIKGKIAYRSCATRPPAKGKPALVV